MNIVTEKKCRKCGNIKPKRRTCLYCKKIRDKKYREKNREKLREKDRQYYRERKKQDPDFLRRKHLKNEYNISLEDYAELFYKQNGVCAICGKTQKGKPLFVDHDHSSGKIRGLLCGICNTALGGFRDKIVLLQEAIKYLNKNKV